MLTRQIIILVISCTNRKRYNRYVFSYRWGYTCIGFLKILDSVLEEKGIMEKGLDASDTECLPSSETSLTATEICHRIKIKSL